MNKKHTKEEVYKTVVDFQKKAGQGLSGIVKVLGDGAGEMSKCLDELISEGLVKACDTGGTIGHRESNIFYTPTKGYNVWDDGGDKHLNFVRFYLGILERKPDEKKSDVYNWIHPSEQAVTRNVDFMKEYAKWLEKNEKALDEMVNLEEDYYKVSGKKKPKIGAFSKDELKWIKDKDWYSENQTVSTCLKHSIRAIDNDAELRGVYEEILPLYKSDPKKYSRKIKETEMELKALEESVIIRKRVNEWLSTCPRSLKIQSLVSKLKP
jgi:hypothetical protein